MNYQQYDYHLENLVYWTPTTTYPLSSSPKLMLLPLPCLRDLIKGNRLPFPEIQLLFLANVVKTYFFQKFLL